jgi:hypothetical protein
LHDPLGIMNLWRIFKKKAMINVVQKLSPVRKVLAKNDIIIIFGEDIFDLGIWEKLLHQNKYIYLNERWGNQSDMSPIDIIDKSIALESDGTERLEYCTYCNEWGHDTFICDYPEDEWRPTFTDHDYDLYDDYYSDD